MSDDPATLGGRLRLFARDSLAPARRKLFDQMMDEVIPWADSAGFLARTDDGEFIGPFNPALLNPATGTAFLELQFTEETHTSLSQRTRQVIILTAARSGRPPMSSTHTPQWPARPGSPMTRCAHWPAAGSPMTSAARRPWPIASPGRCRSSIISTTHCTEKRRTCSAPRGSWTSSRSPASITPCAQS
jgi:hypothetical protein